MMQLNILQITTFVNEFDKKTRNKLSTLNEKLTKLERSLQMAEAAVKTANMQMDWNFNIH